MKKVTYSEFYFCDVANIPYFLWLRHILIEYIVGLAEEWKHIIKLTASIYELFACLFRTMLVPLALILAPIVAAGDKRKASIWAVDDDRRDWFYSNYIVYGISSKHIEKSELIRWDD